MRTGMKVGDIVEVKNRVLCNKVGTKGVVFYDYNDGFQAIFENGDYDGFNPSEADFFLKKIGHSPAHSRYRFKNVMQVSQDFEVGLWDTILKEKQ